MTEPKPTPEQEALLAKVAKKDSRKLLEKTFYRAAEKGQSWLVLQILKSGKVKADNQYWGNAFQSSWPPPLYAAASAGKTEAARVLLDWRADANWSHGQPLIEAAKNRHWDTAKLLLERGANPDLQDGKALVHAVEGQNYEIAELMRKKMGKVLSPLLIARLKDCGKKGEALISLMADLEPVPPLLLEIPAPEKQEPARIIEPPPPVEASQKKAPVHYPAPVWHRTGEREISRVEEKPALGKILTDIFNFETRERIVMIEGQMDKALSFSKEGFDRIENRTILETACDEFIRQGGKIDREEILTRSFIKRDKKNFPGQAP